ncbi:GNAT family N-acetyltransferase [Xylophilus rhododendri]|uniref:GNAT family N-acetyltransferase n=1 Tax=Xylophilus rhododendri TaxID=2697032 RepID=UPI001E55E391|nr:GNAT family N-acetyltransferase [Xylophilus rhododendri]
MRNALEPPALARQFAACPPEGFVVADVLGAPLFVAPFDLLTTADDALKQRAAALPGFARWSRWLRIRTAFVGTTATEYAPLPADAAPAALVAALREGPGRQHRLTIVKDLPQQSPLLADEDNAVSEAFIQALQARGFVAVEGQALAYVPIDFADGDAYLARLSTSRRKNLKRKLRSRAELEILRLPTGPAFADDAAVDAYYALYQGVFAQSEIHFDKLGREFFAGLLRDADNGGIVFEYRRQADGVLLGWNLCFEYGGKLVDKYIGLAYPAAREVNLYFVSWMVNLEYAIERGLSHYIAGWTDPEVKAQLGASFTFTRHMVYVRNPLLRALARRFAGRFESDRTWSEKE